MDSARLRNYSSPIGPEKPVKPEFVPGSLFMVFGFWCKPTFWVETSVHCSRKRQGIVKTVQLRGDSGGITIRGLKSLRSPFGTWPSDIPDGNAALEMQTSRVGSGMSENSG